jgi:hypothetical protein
VHSARTGHPCSLSSSLPTFGSSLAELPSQIVMSVPESGRNRRHVCSCGCNHSVSRLTEWRHQKKPLLPSWGSLNPLHLPSVLASLILWRARSHSSSDPASSSSSAQTTPPPPTPMQMPALRLMIICNSPITCTLVRARSLPFIAWSTASIDFTSVSRGCTH